MADGDQRRFAFIYYKWFYWNAVAGDAVFRIERRASNVVRYVPISDTSYLGSYLGWRHAELTLAPAGDGRTRATLTIAYDRLIDPAWYFGPLQALSVGLAADVFLDNGLASQPTRP